MREIKFRALGQTDEKWHYGLLAFLQTNVAKIFENVYHTWICDANTVGQYTGLKDKNGKEIYEGDILKRTLLPTKRITNISTVKWTPFKSCFSSVDIEGSSVTFISDYINSSYECEVIGNIYENPELLEREV